MADLPTNWVNTTLGEFCELFNGRAFKSSDWSDVGLPIIRIQNLRNPDAQYNRFAGAGDARHLVANGDLLFAWSGTPGTSFKAHIWSGPQAILNQHIFKVVFDDEVANAEFLKIAINATLPSLRKQAKGGAGLKHLTRSSVEGIKIPLPPRREQDRIVLAMSDTAGRLAVLESELEAFVKNTKYVERRILNVAASGSILRPGFGKLDEVPNSDKESTVWRINQVGELQIGRQRSPDVHDGPSMRQYLRVANVFDDYIDTSDVMSMNFDEAEFERYRLAPGDILLNEGQSLELVGRTAMFRGELADVCFTNTLIRFRAGPLVDPEYALLVFRAYQHTGRFREIARITTNLAHLGLRRLAELEFPLVSMTQQKEIVQTAQGLIVKVREAAVGLAQLRTDAQELISALERKALSGLLSLQSELETAPDIALPRNPDRTKPLRSVALQPRADAIGKQEMPTIPLVDVLKQSESALDGQELFIAAGYPEEASVLQVEQFFLELRAGLAEGQIKLKKTHVERFFVNEPI